MFELPTWLHELTIGEIVGLVAALTSLGWVVRRGWKAARRFSRFLDDFFGEPDREGVPGKPGVLARLVTVESDVSGVLHEVTPNGGASAHDHLRAEMRQMRDEIIASNTRLCEEVRQERASALAAHVRELHGLPAVANEGSAS